MRAKSSEQESSGLTTKAQPKSQNSMTAQLGQGASLLNLQRTHGNHFVQRLLYSGVIQAKLSISEPGDKYEREADRVADQVMRMPYPKTGAAGLEASEFQSPKIQRICSGCEESEKMQRQPQEDEEELQDGKADGEVDASVESAIKSIRGGGQSLPHSARDFFEPRFGYDFSQVRIHTGAQADQLTNAVQARAFTVGNDIVFAAGQYTPQGPEGQRLIAHELTHTIQQGVNAPVVARDEANAEPRDTRLPGGDTLQMQGTGKYPQPKTDEELTYEELMFELNKEQFWKEFKKQELNKKINGAMARELAKAYTSRNMRPLQATLHATQYADDRAPVEPSEDEVYYAILSTLDIEKMQKGTKATDWEWRPAPKKGTGNAIEVDIRDWVVDELVDQGKDYLLEKTITGTADYCAARWTAAEGLEVVVTAVFEGLTVIGEIWLALDILDLLIKELKKPVNKLSKQEVIIANVKDWLMRELDLAQKEADLKESMKKPYMYEPLILGQDHAVFKGHVKIK